MRQSLQPATTESTRSSGRLTRSWPWLNIGLSAKVAALVLVGTISMIGLFAYLGTAALSENTERNLQERVILAQMTASYTDALIDNMQGVLVHEASEMPWFEPGSSQALERAYRRLAPFASRLFLIDDTGKMVASHPPLPSPVSFSEMTPVSAVLNGTPFAISHVAQPLDVLGPQMVAAAPIAHDTGRIRGALVISLSLSNPSLRAFSNPIGLGKTGYMDLVALDGRILASTRPSRIGNESDHGSSLRGMIRDHRQSVSACHDCHEPLSQEEPQAEVLAFAPLDRALWGITVHQSESEVFAYTRLLQSRIFELMIVMLCGAMVLVYFTTRAVIVPLRALTAATRRIAAGDLDSPIGVHGRDEVGMLAQSFDEMRLRLKESSEEIQAWNRQLDARVHERTAAYEAAAKDNARLYAELQAKEQVRGELLHRVISAQEDERIRIARELHDETSQSLTALKVGLETVQLALAHDPNEAHHHLRNCGSLVGSLLKNIHRINADLRPTLLDDLGLVAAISWYGEQRLKPLGITLGMNTRGMRERLLPSMETALFRIVQEAITNIVRHAQATQVNIQLVRQEGRLTLQIADNGRGFDPQTLQSSDPQGKGLGLRGMQERASILGGEFRLETALGKGTQITVCVLVPE